MQFFEFQFQSYMYLSLCHRQIKRFIFKTRPVQYWMFIDSFFLCLSDQSEFTLNASLKQVFQALITFCADLLRLVLKTKPHPALVGRKL